ncbi:hypothetical protein DY000_02033435 [Brassica cretica]|uniref:Uncharacterized protein n=1 Tax=Brassica cretica TaxID=69181 RepID=A0ABQ7DBN0_BRACR|nr:hypothetical protein DY000_02033435 [Brassica cretica]
MHGLMSYRRFGRARSLRSDRAERTLGRYDEAADKSLNVHRFSRRVLRLLRLTEA